MEARIEKRRSSFERFVPSSVGFLLVFNSSGKQSGSVKALSWQHWYDPTSQPNTSDLQNQMCHPPFVGRYLCPGGACAGGNIAL